MNMIKISTISLLTLLMICAFIPDASARGHRGHRGKSRSFFGLSFNVAPSPSYVVAPAPVPVMPYRAAVVPAPVYSYYPAYCGPNCYYAPAPVYVERPAPSVYVQPSFSFSSSWRN